MIVMMQSSLACDDCDDCDEDGRGGRGGAGWEGSISGTNRTTVTAGTPSSTMAECDGRNRVDAAGLEGAQRRARKPGCPAPENTRARPGARRPGGAQI